MEKQHLSLLKKIGRIGFAILLILLMVLCIIFAFKEEKSKSSGNLAVIVKDIDGDIVSSEIYEYDKGDSLFKILNKNYDLEYKMTVYGHYLTGINDIKVDGLTEWLWLEVGTLKEGKSFSSTIDVSDYDIENASTGVDNIKLKGDMILGICQRDDTHSTSITGDTIDANYSMRSYKNIKIALFVIIAVLFVAVVIYSFIRIKASEEHLTIRKMCILSLMAVILLVQEEALTFLPNIQLTFLLISIYAAVFGKRYSFIIILIHVILDNMIMGSLNPIVMIPMLMGYTILVIVMNMLKNYNIVIKCIGAVVCSLIYCYLFLITNALMLDINIYAYWISDIPFEILLVLSTIFTIIYFYKPIHKIVYREWNKNELE